MIISLKGRGTQEENWKCHITNDAECEQKSVSSSSKCPRYRRWEAGSGEAPGEAHRGWQKANSKSSSRRSIFGAAWLELGVWGCFAGAKAEGGRLSQTVKGFMVN